MPRAQGTDFDVIVVMADIVRGPYSFKFNRHHRYNVMPQVVVFALSGRTSAQKKGLMKAITEAVSEHFKVDPQGVIVQIVEADRDSKSEGGVPYSER